METFRENMKDEERIRVPGTYSQYSTKKVLAMECIDAVKCGDVEEIREMDIDEEEIAKTGIRCIIKQILRDGLLHADPHPSNFMVDREGNFVFLDFGMIRITEKTQRELGMLMLTVAEEDVDGVVETVKRISEVEEDAEIESFRREIEEQILKLRDTTIQEQSVSKVLIEISTKAAKRGIYLPTKITLIGKGLLTMEGIGLKIYPEFQLQNEFKHEVQNQLIEQNKP
jgi:ubiquinone biosynthesis protein